MLADGLKKKQNNWMDNFYWKSFKTFLKIGMFTFGSEHAMISIIKSEVVDKHKWMDNNTFSDLVAGSQSCPGAFSVNISIFIGYKLRKTRGALCTGIGIALPSIIIIILAAMLFHYFENNKVIAAIFRGIRPAVVALIAVPTFNLAKSANIGWSSFWIPIAGALAIWALGVSPIYIIIIAGLGGFLYGKFIKPTE